MHIPDGILPNAVMLGTNVAAVGLTALSLYQVGKAKDPRALVPKASLLTAAFFVASSIRFPFPPPMTSVHLMLVALMGALLGWLSFPAIIVGLILQALVFHHGGLSSIGANALILGIPALLIHFMFNRTGARKPSKLRIMGGVGGFIGVALAVFMFYWLIITTIPADIDIALERRATLIMALSHLPVALAEGAFMAFLLPYLFKVRPKMLAF